MGSGYDAQFSKQKLKSAICYHFVNYFMRHRLIMMVFLKRDNPCSNYISGPDLVLECQNPHYDLQFWWRVLVVLVVLAVLIVVTWVK